MRDDELKQLFDKQAAGYDAQWSKLSPIRDCLHLLVESVFVDLPDDARILCVGVGTGSEIEYLAQKRPLWKFTVVEPSSQMLAECRRKFDQSRISSRCEFHEGYLDSLQVNEMHHAGTCFLVSQFILDRQARIEFFSKIASWIEPGGVLASSDLSSEVGTNHFENLLQMWMKVISTSDISVSRLEKMQTAYANDVGILPPEDVTSIIEAGGFESPVQFFQAGLIRAWFSKRKV
jgi:tRNA (cmo5U34)-methyltransferase